MCDDCLPYEPKHLYNWLDDAAALLIVPLFRRAVGPKLLARGEKLIDDIFLKLGIFALEKDFVLSSINQIAAAFIAEARGRGIEISALRGPGGYTDYFRMRIGNRAFDFEKLPRVEHAVKNRLASLIDDKWLVKQELMRHGLPVSPGKPFWFFEKRGALNWAKSAGYPLIVKPRRGSLSQHIYFDIRSEQELKVALRGVIRYSPVFVIERFLPKLTLFRATVVDGAQVFGTKRLPPKVLGDGIRTVRELMSRVSFPDDRVNRIFLREQGLELDGVPQKGEIVYLHNKIILSLGAEIEDVTKTMHEDNRALFRRVAEIFGNKLMGIDFLGEDIAVPWKNQRCAIIEINSMPNITMHSFKDKFGNTSNKVAEALVQMVFKYYG